MFKPAGILLLGALLFGAGCATTSPLAEEPITSPPPSPGASSLNWSDPEAVPLTRPTHSKTSPAAAGQSKRPPAALSKPAPVPVTTWTSLNRWAAERHLPAPRLISKTPLVSYQVRSDSGAMILALGSREANWNGMEILLGFEPQLIDGQVFLHSLDLQKNLEPLLSPPPLMFGPHPVIVIDPGHGGINAGTKSVRTGRGEKEFTLDWAKRLAPLLEAGGWQVFLTRTNDTDIALSNRVAFAEAHHADVFLSLHFNSAAPDTRQSGLETYSLTPAGMPSTLTRGYDDTWTQSFPNNAFDAENQALAARLHGALLHAAGEEDRGLRHARFLGVLRGQKRPAVLLEGGYLSNPAEAQRIEDPGFRQKLAEALAAALNLNAAAQSPRPESGGSAIEISRPTPP